MGVWGFFDSNVKGNSQFWQNLHKVKHLFKWGLFLEWDGNYCKLWQGC